MNNSPDQVALPMSEDGNTVLCTYLQRRVYFPKSEQPDISIIIPVYNQYFYTISCLHALEHVVARSHVSCEVILADDDSTDETKDIGQFVQNLRIIRNESGVRGFLPNVNFAAARAQGRILFLLNNDTIPVSDGLLDHIALFLSKPSIGVVGTCLLHPDGRFMECGRMILSNIDNVVFPPTNWQSTKPLFMEWDMVAGAAFAVRRADWIALHGFDPIFGRGYYEETDFCFRMKTELRLHVVSDLSSKIIHFANRSFTSEKQRIYLQKNCQLFWKRWRTYLQERERRFGIASPEALSENGEWVVKLGVQLWQALYENPEW